MIMTLEAQPAINLYIVAKQILIIGCGCHQVSLLPLPWNMHLKICIVNFSHSFLDAFCTKVGVLTVWASQSLAQYALGRAWIVIWAHLIIGLDLD